MNSTETMQLKSVNDSACGKDYKYCIIRKLIRNVSKKVIIPESKQNSICIEEKKNKCWIKFKQVFFVTSLIASITGSFLVLATDVLDHTVLQQLILENDSFVFNIWKKPPAYPIARMYIFNYTNTERYEAGIDNKLEIQELGPYTYRQTIRRVDVSFHNNGTMSYRMNTTFKFLPELSKGSEDDVIIVPNMIMLLALGALKNADYFRQFGFNVILRTFDAKPFVELSVKEFLWGYSDKMYQVFKTILKLSNQVPVPENFGIFAPKNGIPGDLLTLYTGSVDINHIGEITNWQGEERMKSWGSDSCNEINGSDGMFFPPSKIQAKKRLYLYQKDMCRKLPLDFVGVPTDRNDCLPAMRYRAPLNVFATKKENPENECFCVEGKECPPSGTFDVSSCVLDAPLLVSLPHFHQGDPSLFENFEGLHPEIPRELVVVDLHEKYGIPLGGSSTLQLNLMIKQPKYVRAIKPMKDGMILPITWARVSLDVLPIIIMMPLIYLVYFKRAMYIIFPVSSFALLYLIVKRIRQPNYTSVMLKKKLI